MQLHDKEERFNAQLRMNFINRAVVDILSRDEGHIYFCKDGDIFILFNGALTPIVNRLGNHFGDLDPEQLRGQKDDRLFSFFDLNKHWQGFMELCKEKAARALVAHDCLPQVTRSLALRRPESANA